MKYISGIFAAALTLGLTGCVYILHPVSPPSPHQLKVIAASPELYTVRVLGEDYPVGADGRVVFGFPGLRAGCGPYLFGIPTRRVSDPFKDKTISLLRAGKVVRKFSLSDILKLPADPSGNRLLAVKNPRP